MQGKTGDSLQVIFVLINTYIPFSDLNFGTSTGIFFFVWVPAVIVSALVSSAGQSGASVYSLRLE